VGYPQVAGRLGATARLPLVAFRDDAAQLGRGHVLRSTRIPALGPRVLTSDVRPFPGGLSSRKPGVPADLVLSFVYFDGLIWLVSAQ